MSSMASRLHHEFSVCWKVVISPLFQTWNAVWYTDETSTACTQELTCCAVHERAPEQSQTELVLWINVTFPDKFQAESLAGRPLKFKQSSRVLSHAATVGWWLHAEIWARLVAPQSLRMCVLREWRREREWLRERGKMKERERLIIPGKGFYKPQDSHYRSLSFRLS